MKTDIEYWKAETGLIMMEPQTIKGRTALVAHFPLYRAGKCFDAYVAGNGTLRWEFPANSSELESFLDNTSCTTHG